MAEKGKRFPFSPFLMTDKEITLVKTVFDNYVSHYPQEWEQWKKEQAQRRRDLVDKFGAMKGEGAMRFAGSIPKRLDMALRIAYMKVLQKEDYLTPDFLNTFTQFRVAEKL